MCMSRLRFSLVVCGALGGALLFGVASAALPSGVAGSAVGAAVPSVSVYDAIPNPLPPNVASLGFQSNHTAEFGDYVHLAGTGRKLTSVTVTLSDHALYSDYSNPILYPAYAGNSVSWTHPITINVYTNHLDANGVPDQKIATVTQTVTIPWLPPSYGFSGIAFNASFDMSSLNVTLPNDVIVSVAFNTETFGSAPLGVPGPYISLNVGAPTGGVATSARTTTRTPSSSTRRARSTTATAAPAPSSGCSARTRAGRRTGRCRSGSRPRARRSP